MITYLRVYDPKECAFNGVPLEWESHLKDEAIRYLNLIGRTRIWSTADHSPRCEGCGHPQSYGTFPEGIHPTSHEFFLHCALMFFRSGLEPNGVMGTSVPHYSPCDSECRHGDTGRYFIDGKWKETTDMPIVIPKNATYEADWRSVDVRTLGWPHDLRPHKLAMLCLRCYAETAR